MKYFLLGGKKQIVLKVRLAVEFDISFLTVQCRWVAKNSE